MNERLMTRSLNNMIVSVHEYGNNKWTKLIRNGNKNIKVQSILSSTMEMILRYKYIRPKQNHVHYSHPYKGNVYKFLYPLFKTLKSQFRIHKFFFHKKDYILKITKSEVHSVCAYRTMYNFKANLVNSKS